MIKSRSNPLIKLARSLRERKTRNETGLFLVEGILPVGELVAAGWTVDAILYAPETLKSPFAHGLISDFAGRKEQVSVEVMDYLAAKENAAGILAIARARRFALPEVEGVRRGTAIVAPQDAGNVGTLLRTMDAVGCDALILLDGGVDPYHPAAIRAAMGSTFWMAIIQTRYAVFVEWAKRHKIQLVGTSAHAKQDYLAWKPAEPWILLLGNEQKGLSAAQLHDCDVSLSLPMKGRISSLNVAVAAGVLLYRLTSAAHASPIQ